MAGALQVTEVRRGVRDRCAAGPLPAGLPLLGPEDRALLQRWVRRDNPERRRPGLVQEAGPAGIERAERLCELLLEQGWIARREHLRGGSWQWEALTWRDLPALQRLLGVRGAAQREEERAQRLAVARGRLAQRRASAGDGALDPDLLDELERALEALALERSLRLEVLAVRLDLLAALVDWHDAGEQGSRREFALRARGDTKAIGAADWRWLASCFDLERLGIGGFAPTLWLAGELVLRWGARQVDLGALHCVGLPLADLMQANAAGGAPQRWWLVENRASFERQARQREPGQVLAWLPGRPPRAWMQAMDHLLALAPAPAWISADADPAGVDIACSVGRLWQARGLVWEPHRMGLTEWAATSQRWALNEHDRALLVRLLAQPELPAPLRALCEAMQREGRKAEQEGWM